MDLSFEQAATRLATTAGGYTLWLGAGVAMASCPATPSWNGLTRSLAAGETLPADWDAREYADRLEWLACTLGHRAFRAGLRKAVVDPFLGETAVLNEETVFHQGLVGARAGAVASFNIEMISSAPFSMAPLPGSFVPRPYLESHDNLPLHLVSDGGAIGRPVFYPHGLLDVAGQCVITRSEYVRHEMSMAVSVAVNLCLGGDLVILGMSMSDSYLRDAIVRNRRWIREVYWFDHTFSHAEWARVARVHCVHVEHNQLWSGLANMYRNHDPRHELRKLIEVHEFKERTLRAVHAARTFVAKVPGGMADLAKKYLAGPHYLPSDLRRFAGQCDDHGVPIDDAFLNDPRMTRENDRSNL